MIVVGKFRHATSRCARVYGDCIPVNKLEQLLVVEELGRQLELKNALASAFRACGDLGRLVALTHP